MSEDSIENRQQFAHARGQGNFLRFARLAQPCVEGANHRIEAGGDQCRHGPRTPHACPPSPDRATAPPRAAIAVQWGNADEGGNLMLRQLAQFWQFGQQGRGQHRPHSGYTAQQGRVFAPHGVALHHPHPFLVEIIPFRFQPREVDGDPLLHGKGSGVVPVLFRREHRDQLAATHEHGGEGMRVRVGYGARGGAYRVGEVGQHCGIQSVGLPACPWPWRNRALGGD